MRVVAVLALASAVFLATWLEPERALGQSLTDHGDEYLARLSLMQQTVETRKLRGVASALGTAQPTPTSALVGLGLHRRFFEPGQTWAVEFRAADNPIARKTTAPEDLLARDETRRPTRFRFRVLEVDNGPRGRVARVEVRQSLAPGDVRVDPRVEREVLSINEQFVTVQKDIYYRDGRAPLAVPLGSSNIASGFEAFPVDLPDLGSVEGVPLTEVPPELASRLSPGERERALDFRFRDLYARPARAIWADGDVWPAYYSGASGVAVRAARGGAP